MYAGTHDAVGNQIDDGEDYEYVYDPFGRLRFVNRTDNQALVAEYRYNGLGFRVGWHYDVDADGTVENTSDDPWFYFAYDEGWRMVATYRSTDSSPKEQFVHHVAGLGGFGGSSYIDGVILRERDANTAWASAADGTLEERLYYCQNFYEAGPVKSGGWWRIGRSTLLSGVSGRCGVRPGPNQPCGNAHSGERSYRLKF